MPSFALRNIPSMKFWVLFFIFFLFFPRKRRRRKKQKREVDVLGEFILQEMRKLLSRYLAHISF